MWGCRRPAHGTRVQGVCVNLGIDLGCRLEYSKRGGQENVPVTTLTSEFRLLTVRDVRGLD